MEPQSPKSQWRLFICGFHQQNFQDIGNIRVLHTFSHKEQPQIHCNCVWDGFYLCVSVGNEIWTVSEGRWETILEGMSRSTSEKVVKVWDMGLDSIFRTVQGKIFSRHSLNGEVTYIRMESPVRSSHWVDNKFCILCDNGTVYLRLLDMPLPGKQLSLGWSVKAISCGSDHILLLEENTGRVWSMGQNLRGQLGHGDLEKKSEPCIIEGLDGVKVIEISSGLWHNLVLSEFGDLYSWGWNAHGQLGLPGSTALTVSLPCLIPMKDDLEFCQVSCGSRHSVALAKCGKLLSWGWNEYGQLCRAGISDGPTEVCMPGGMSVSWMACGPWSTFIMGVTNEAL